MARHWLRGQSPTAATVLAFTRKSYLYNNN
jgi:hypothetical protein